MIFYLPQDWSLYAGGASKRPRPNGQPVLADRLAARQQVIANFQLPALVGQPHLQALGGYFQRQGAEGSLIRGRQHLPWAESQPRGKGASPENAGPPRLRPERDGRLPALRRLPVMQVKPALPPVKAALKGLLRFVLLAVLISPAADDLDFRVFFHPKILRLPAAWPLCSTPCFCAS